MVVRGGHRQRYFDEIAASPLNRATETMFVGDRKLIGIAHDSDAHCNCRTVCTLILLVQIVAPITLHAKAEDSTVRGRWETVESMHERREYAGGVALLDGHVLPISGHPLDGKSISSGEVFDPSTRKWSDTGLLSEARKSGNAATLLSDGPVMLAGGHTNAHVIRGAELFDPRIGQWSDAGNLRAGRDPTANLLRDGCVLFSGGINWYIDSGKVYSECEIYDPKSGAWAKTGSLNTARHQHRAVLLDDGRILVVGGYREGNVLLDSAEIYDPTTGTWRTTGELPEPRAAFEMAQDHTGKDH